MNPDVLQTVLETLCAGLFVSIGALLLGRKTGGDYRKPIMMFSMWWIILGIDRVIEVAVRILNHDYGIYSLNVPLYYVFWAIAPLGIYGLLYYTIFLFSGRNRLAVPLGLFYLAITVIALATIAASGAYVADANDVNLGVQVNQPGNIAYLRPLSYAFIAAVLSALILPQIAVCIALYSIYPKMSQPTQKFRLAMIATAMLLFFGSTFVATLTGRIVGADWETLSKSIYLASAVIVYAAYSPPRLLREKYGLVSIFDERESTAGSGEAASEGSGGN